MERRPAPERTSRLPTDVPPMSSPSKPSKNEEEFFARADAELRKQLRERADAERAAATQAERNRCPRCDVPLVARENHGVTIDQCPQCEGIWLDKGELEILATGKERESGFVGSLLRIWK